MGGFSGDMSPGGPPAEFVPRLIAYIIDFAMGFALSIPGIFLLIVGSAIGGGFGFLILLVGLLLGAVAFFAWLYVIFMGMAVNGQTPGKRMQGVKVTQDSGAPLGLGGAIIRWLVGGLFNSICGIPLGSLWMLWDGEKKTLYDKVLNYRAVSVPKGELMPIFPNGKPF